MIDFARLPLDERTPYIQEVADRRGLTRLIVEKDFWVCFTLRLLFTVPEFAGKFIFKGGTSLSKVFGIIKRFSEDIDLSIDPDWLGFGGENRPDAAPSRSQFERRRKKLDKACIAAVESRVAPPLERAIQQVLGQPDTDAGYLEFEVDERTLSPVLTFRYPTAERISQGYIRPQVKLELGSLTDQQPTGDYTVAPWVGEEFPEQFRELSCGVVALEAERTFWEKATILHAEYHRPQNKPMRTRLSRDCYDLCLMSTHDAGRRALVDRELLKRVVHYKQTYFHSSWANYEAAISGRLRLVPHERRLADLRTDFREMRAMFLEEPPSFDEILVRLKEIEHQVNGAVRR